MDNPKWKASLDEAADIYVRLADDPDNSDLKAEKAAFIARGELERRAFAHIHKVWQAGGAREKPNRTIPALAFLLLIGAGAWIAPQARMQLLSDFATWQEPKNDVLVSGDFVHLDAHSALDERTDVLSRGVEILQGAAFFRVRQESRPFRVVIGDLTVEVVGTEFETSFADGDIMVAVQEGQVSVSHVSGDWSLVAGDRLILGDEGTVHVESISAASVAGWRADSFVADGLTFGQVAAVLDRRISGNVIILDDEVADIRVSGHYDLDDPVSALRLLGQTVGAKVRAFPPFATIVSR